ncbi:MAG: 50S ribosomal protein L35 [Chloroflexi bacterium]|nr:50S ribosomal protein L35 [Chloroflexota bacterium]MCX6002743.1 50S ribosomal protein L35 [Chloroflexota bacterium]
MPKLKTHKGAKKRFHFTGGGKIMRVKQGKSHFRRRKSAATKGLYDETIPLHKADVKRIKKLLPYH